MKSTDKFSAKIHKTLSLWGLIYGPAAATSVFVTVVFSKGIIKMFTVFS
jgi:hypothetical protein